MDPDRHFEVEDVRPYQALLQMADLVVHHRGVPELLPELAQRLRKVASFEVASFSLYDPDKNVMRMHFWDGSERLSDLTELPVAESACGFVWEKQRPMICPDLQQETRFQPAVNILMEKGVRSYCGLPLTTGQKRLGALGLGSSRPNAYDEEDVHLLRGVAELVALGLENAITRAAFLEEKERLEVLLEVGTTLMSNLDVQQLFPAISDLIRRVVRQDYASIALYEDAHRCLLWRRTDCSRYGGPHRGLCDWIGFFERGNQGLQPRGIGRGRLSGHEANGGTGNPIVLFHSFDHSEGQAGNAELGQRYGPGFCAARRQLFETGGCPGGHRSG
jgi:putative methionine-R-sulfoxide reductase with GAF domain